MADEHDALREEIRRLGPWHYDIEIAPGVRTGDPALAPPYDPALGTPSIVDPAGMLLPVTRTLFGGSLEGRSFLDCACNGGGYVFAAAALGASRAYGFDARRHWIDQAEFLARHVPSERTSFGCHTLAELPNLALEPFDVTLFSGIFYHLPDPVAGLRIAADLTRELLIVNTAARHGQGDALVLNEESDALIMSGVDRLAWLPNGLHVMERVLAWCGFPHTRLGFDRIFPNGTRRMMIVAARTPETLAGFRPLGEPGRWNIARRARAAVARLARRR